MNDNGETKYGELIGEIGGDYYYLDYVFEHSDSFKGATATVLRPVAFSEAESRREEFDEDGELWRCTVASESTELSMDEWHKSVLDNDGDDAIFDFGGGEYHEDLLDRIDPERQEYELVECIGGGRSFSLDMKWDKLYNPELWEVIKKYES